MSVEPPHAQPTNVVRMGEFKARLFRDVWTCTCGGQDFALFVNGSISCQACNTLHEHLVWGEKPGT